MGNPILIVGNVGAGKSTYAHELVRSQDAHLFSVDEWMSNLFRADLPEVDAYEWSLVRLQRIEKQILSEALRLIDRNIQVILDLGFFGREQRDRVITALKEQHQKPVIHYLDVDKETRWQRVNQRNTEKLETFQFHVNQETFEFCETIFEPLDTDERREAIIVNS